MAGESFANKRESSDMTNSPVALSPRQIECLQWASTGKTSKETGLILGVSERTVNFHLYSAFTRLSVHSKQAAVARAIILHLLDTRVAEPASAARYGASAHHGIRSESTNVCATSRGRPSSGPTATTCIAQP
jgi:LuxR family transcriptional regulator of spore coat protein